MLARYVCLYCVKQGPRYALKDIETLMKVLQNIQYGIFPENQLDMYLPDVEGFDTIVYFYGGGMECGDKADENYLGIAQGFVKKRIRLRSGG